MYNKYFTIAAVSIQIYIKVNSKLYKNERFNNIFMTLYLIKVRLAHLCDEWHHS